MSFIEGQVVRVHHTDALGKRTEYAGKIVRFEQNVKMWRVDIGGIAITFEEGDIHAIQEFKAEEVHVGGGTQPGVREESGHTDAGSQGIS